MDTKDKIVILTEVVKALEQNDVTIATAISNLSNVMLELAHRVEELEGKK